MSKHGLLTAKIGKDLQFKGCDVFYDHGDPTESNVGKIVSSIEKDYSKRDRLSQLDIAVVEPASNRVLALVEIEETTDRPKTLLGDIFGVLFGEYVSFKRKELEVGSFTTLLVAGVGEAAYEQRNEHILAQARRAKASLGTKNAAIETIIMKVFANGDELNDKLPSEISGIVEKAMGVAAS